MEESIKIMTHNLINILFSNEPSIYLFGSIVLDDFKFGWSDIDIICLTEKPISKNQADELVVLRQTLLSLYPENLYFRSFEGIITTWNVCINNLKDLVVYWGTSGQRIMDSFTIDTFSTIEILKYGRLLYGEDKRNRIKYPSNEEINTAIKEHYNTIRKYATKTDSHIYSAGWLLDIARCIYTAKTYDIIPKTKAGIWAIDSGISPEPEILKKAVIIRENPMKYKNDETIQNWLSSLGPSIQLFANVLKDIYKLDLI